MTTSSPVSQLAEQTTRVVDKAVRSLEGPLDDFGPFMVAVPGDGSPPRLLDLPDGLLGGDAAGKAEVVRRLVRPAIAELGAKRIAWVATVFTLDLEGKSDAEAGEAVARLMSSGIADHPDRRESLIVNAMDADVVETRITRVVRTTSAPPTLGPWEDFDDAGKRLLGLEARSFYGETSLLEPLQTALRESPGRPRRTDGHELLDVAVDGDGFVVSVRGGDAPITWLARAREYPTLEAARVSFDALGPLLDTADDLGAWRGRPTRPDAAVVVVVGAPGFVEQALQLADAGEPHTLSEADVRFFVARRLDRLANTPSGRSAEGTL
jgi:hypothetical protein